MKFHLSFVIICRDSQLIYVNFASNLQEFIGIHVISSFFGQLMPTYRLLGRKLRSVDSVPQPQAHAARLLADAEDARPLDVGEEPAPRDAGGRGRVLWPKDDVLWQAELLGSGDPDRGAGQIFFFYFEKCCNY